MSKTVITNDTEGADRQIAVKKMNSATLAKHKDWQRMSMQANKAELATNWKKAQDIKEMEEQPDKYSDQAAVLLFDANSMDRHTLRLYRNVGRYFSDKEVQGYIKHNEENPYTPIHWTHLIYLSNVNDNDFRKDVIKKIQTEGWSCNTVQKRCDEHTVNNPGIANRPAQRLKPTNAMKKIAKHSQELVASLVGIEDAAFVERLDSIKPSDIAKTLQHVKSAEEMLDTLEQSLQDRRAIITSTREKLVQRQTVLDQKAKGKAPKAEAPKAAPAPVVAAPKVVKKVVKKAAAVKKVVKKLNK